MRFLESEMKDNLSVDLGPRSYSIQFGYELNHRLRAKIGQLTLEDRRGVLLVDSLVAEKQYEYIRSAFGNLPTFVIPNGEGNKNFETLRRVIDYLAESQVDRAGFLFAFGGGVTGDLGGFAAASFLRGIDYYQVPTTLLAMVDSSVGGKTGVNIRAGKNLAGAFHQPRGVFIDTGLLETLPLNEFSSGMAEVIKTALLADEEFYRVLFKTQRLSPDNGELLSDIVKRCCRIKASVVIGDEKELAVQGGRALLNLGHTFGHAIEVATNYSCYLHGEAVSVGLGLAARLSEELGLIETAEVESIIELLARYDLPTKMLEPISKDRLIEAMTRDKKVKKGKLRFVVLNRIGRAELRDDIPEVLIRKLLADAGATI